MAGPNLLETGIYTVSEAAALVGATKRQVRGWIAGYPNTKVAPILANDLGWIDDRLAFSFANLMELRFVAFFSNAGVRVREIRSIMDEVKTTLRHPHPFSTNVVFKTDGRKIVAEIASRHGIPKIYDLRSRNYEMIDVVLESLRNDVVYDPAGYATAWHPRRALAPNVIIHPMFSFGRPVLKDSRIPTQTLAKAVNVEGSVSIVAALFEVQPRRVREAVKFENSFQQAA
jgi:uncharacterized protein (DUF433 family)/DNA-binding transcriptional MerR regulator